MDDKHRKVFIMKVNVIYDEEKAIREKQDVDATNKKLYLPVRIVGYLTLTIIAFAVVVICLSVTDILSSVWMGLAIVIAVFSVVIWFLVWGLVDERWVEYSANVKYYVATKGKTIKGHGIQSIGPGRCGTRTNWLVVVVEDEKHKTKKRVIPVFDCGPKKDVIECDAEVDLVNGYLGYGHWYHSLDRDIVELIKYSEWND